MGREEVAAFVLADPRPHRARNYTLAGPGAAPWSEVTDALTAALGWTIVYTPASVPGYVCHRSHRGLPWGAIAVQTVLHFLLRFGHGATTDPTMARLLGRSGRTIGKYVQDHAEVWAKARG